MLDAKIFDISINSAINHSNSFVFPLPVSFIKEIQTFDSLADFKECVKKFIKSFFELAELAST